MMLMWILLITGRKEMVLSEVELPSKHFFFK